MSNRRSGRGVNSRYSGRNLARSRDGGPVRRRGGTAGPMWLCRARAPGGHCRGPRPRGRPRSASRRSRCRSSSAPSPARTRTRRRSSGRRERKIAWPRGPGASGTAARPSGMGCRGAWGSGARKCSAKMWTQAPRGGVKRRRRFASKSKSSPFLPNLGFQCRTPQVVRHTQWHTLVRDYS